jgi:hypothetical protein
MFEGVGTLHAEMMRQVDAVDEVWVPSSFHQLVLVQNGAPAHKVHVVPEATDSSLMRTLAASLVPFARISDGRTEPLPSIPNGDTSTAATGPLVGVTQHPPAAHTSRAPEDVHFLFISIFKLEDRKGWHELVHAFCHAFSRNDTATLVLRTYIYGSSNGENVGAIRQMINSHLDTVRCRASAAERKWRPRMAILASALSYTDMLRLYKSADCYVSARGSHSARAPTASMHSVHCDVCTVWGTGERALGRGLGVANCGGDEHGRADDCDQL